VLVRSVLSRIWPNELIQDVAVETRISINQARFSRSAKARFSGKRSIFANIGCGGNIAPGWENIDIAVRPDVTFWDCRRSLPFDDNSCSYIFAEHVFEHLEPLVAGHFLSECHRCLACNGVLRIVVPDAGMYLKNYDGGWDHFVAARPLVRDGQLYRDHWLGTAYRTKMEFINAIFRQGTEHKYAYDAETLILRFRAAGFRNATQQQFGKSTSPMKPLDTADRAGDSLYVEAVKN
jgi:predicted SAM-dependent methyltransferase